MRSTGQCRKKGLSFKREVRLIFIFFSFSNVRQ